MSAPVKNKRYSQYRGAVVALGFSGLSAWAKSRKYPATTVYSSARGERPKGKISRKITKELEALIHA